MDRSSSCLRLRLIAGTLFLLAVVAVFGGPALAAVPDELQNPGLEMDLAGWKVTGPAGGNALVVQTDTSAEYPVYTGLGIANVYPFTGDKMLRIGTPRWNRSPRV